MKNKIIVHTDGGARGNPGPAAIGVVIEGLSSSKEIIGEYIGEATNNVAEYRALVLALAHLIKSGKQIESVACYADSELMVKQLKGEYKVKDTNIRALFLELQSLISALNVPVTFHHVPRAKNVEADEMVNKLLDEKLGKKAI